MIYIGTSGFSYDDWKGPFYPEKMAKKDMLAYYARQFPMVEINSTYYAIPGLAAFAGMAKNTPEDFKFVVKLHKDITHSEQVQQQSMDAFMRAVQPLVDAGKLSCLLAQYPWSFTNTPSNMDRIKSLKDSVKEIPTVVEFRNAQWVHENAFELLRSLDLGFCSVDEPQLKGLMPKIAEFTSNIGYVRFHGRNSKDWWKHEESWQRYDYLYKPEELQEWVPKIQEMSARTQTTYLLFNTHYKGKAVINAKALAKMLNITLPEMVNEQLSLL